MKRIAALAVLSALVASLSGCITPHAYVDPQYHKATYESIQRPAQPMPVKVDVHFERNGAPYPKVDNELRGHVEQTLKATGVFVPSTDVTQATITVTANNIADLGAARSKGFVAGLTFGGAGQVVDDDYEFVCLYQAAGTDKTFTYHHAIHTVIGNADAPIAGVAPMPLANAFSKVVEDVMLNFVKDLQDNGVIAKQ